MGILSWYRQLKRRQKLVIQAATFVTLGQVLMNVLYIISWPYRFTLNPIEWNALIFSADTSIAAVYYSLYGIWTYDKAIETTVATAKKEVFDRLGVPFIKNLAEFGRKLDQRWAELTPGQRASILKKTGTIVDRIFSSLSREGPKPERKRVRTIQHGR